MVALAVAKVRCGFKSCIQMTLKYAVHHHQRWNHRMLSKRVAVLVWLGNLPQSVPLNRSHFPTAKSIHFLADSTCNFEYLQADPLLIYISIDQ